MSRGATQAQHLKVATIVQGERLLALIEKGLESKLVEPHPPHSNREGGGTEAELRRALSEKERQIEAFQKRNVLAEAALTNQIEQEERYQQLVAQYRELEVEFRA